ncbi:hypothetical protein PIROE2DRAFT_7507 [Piromyces sp. E2]|nr:hypothetical protein PIROE2DRAFT_7507 [Piromyces sp. E2]|eukprot:OUM65487.1 hypothetical protein PIROE2DRAFT_7507 [Piromyces sp. E2]
MEIITNSMEPSNNHSLELATFKSFSFCSICKKLLWGVTKQGYTCTKCGMNIHETCKNLLPQICIPNPEAVKYNSSLSSPSSSKNSLSLNLSSTSSIIKSLQNNNLMMEATQKIQNTKTLVKDKIHQLNNSNEINNIILSRNSNSSSKSNSRDNSKESINNEVNSNINNTEGKLILLSDSNDDDFSNDSSEVSKKNKIKKLNKKKISFDNKDDISDSEETKNNNIFIANMDINNAIMLSESENSQKLLRRRNNKDKNDDIDNISNLQQTNNELNLFDSEKSNEQSKESNIKECKIINTEYNDENTINENENNNIKNDDTLNESTIISSISNFQTSELTEIIKESSSHKDEITKLKSLKSKPSQSEISSVIVTGTNNKNSSIESNISELDTNGKLIH